MTAPSVPITAVGRRLHVTAEQHGRDLDAAQAAAHAFLTALGIDLDHGALADTPARMARAYSELLTPREFDLTTFPNDEGYEQLVMMQGIPFRSLCEHHALPFIGTADVGYLPGKRIIGLSKLARVVELFAHRAQVQERMTKQVTDWLADHLAPKGVGGCAARRAPVHDVARSPSFGNHHGDVGAARPAVGRRARPARVRRAGENWRPCCHADWFSHVVIGGTRLVLCSCAVGAKP